MALWFNDAYLTVWDRRQNSSGTYSVNVSNSSKQRDGSYVTDFRGWMVLSKSANDTLSSVTIPVPSGARPVRIKATGNLVVLYDKENKKEHSLYKIISCELAEDNYDNYNNQNEDEEPF